MNKDALEKLRMDYILDLRNGRYDIKFSEVMDVLSSGLNDKPLLNEMIKAHEKRYGKIKVHTATEEESKEYEEKRRQEVMALEKEYEEERRR
tara:strand:- start:197 stop:472 length:276 start_codon:yes stop_codon:yes gene_type:complete